jgi:transposase
MAGSELLFTWKRRMLEGGRQAVHAGEDVIGTSRVRELEKRVRDGERLLGRKTMEVEILKEALDLARAKNPPGSCPPGTPARTLPDEGCRRHPRRRSLDPRRAPRQASSAAWILPQARGPAPPGAHPRSRRCAALPQGYRRVTALVNRKLRGDGKPVVNAKRVLRIMRASGLTLAPHTA